jgi:hypothetical protein
VWEDRRHNGNPQWRHAGTGAYVCAYGYPHWTAAEGRYWRDRHQGAVFLSHDDPCHALVPEEIEDCFVPVPGWLYHGLLADEVPPGVAYDWLLENCGRLPWVERLLTEARPSRPR